MTRSEAVNAHHDDLTSIQKAAGTHPFPIPQVHLPTRRALVEATIRFVDHQGETRSDLSWSRHACVQLLEEKERTHYLNGVMDDCTPLATLLLNAIVSGRFNKVFNRNSYNHLYFPSTLPAVEGIYFVGAFKSSGKLLFGYVGRSKNIGNRILQHQKIINNVQEDADHQQLFYRVARYAHQSGLSLFYQPLITIPPQSPRFTTAILETIFATALGTYQKDPVWLQDRARFHLPSVPFLGVNSTACLEVSNDLFPQSMQV